MFLKRSLFGILIVSLASPTVPWVSAQPPGLDSSQNQEVQAPPSYAEAVGIPALVIAPAVGSGPGAERREASLELAPGIDRSSEVEVVIHPDPVPEETVQLLSYLLRISGSPHADQKELLREKLMRTQGRDWPRLNRILSHLTQYFELNSSEERDHFLRQELGDPDLNRLNQAFKQFQAARNAELDSGPASSHGYDSYSRNRFVDWIPFKRALPVYHGVIGFLEVGWLFGLFGCIDRYCSEGYHTAPDPHFRQTCWWVPATKYSAGHMQCTHPDTVCISDFTGESRGSASKSFNHDKAKQYIGIPEYVFLGAQALPYVVATIGYGASKAWECTGSVCSQIARCFTSCKRKNQQRTLEAEAHDCLKQLEQEVGIQELDPEFTNLVRRRLAP